MEMMIVMASLMNVAFTRMIYVCIKVIALQTMTNRIVVSDFAASCEGLDEQSHVANMVHLKQKE